MQRLVLILLSGCSLYADPDARGSAGAVTTLVDARDPMETLARCEDGSLYRVQVSAYATDQPGHGAGEVFGHCDAACQSAAVDCADATCAGAEQTLCSAASSQGLTCNLEGTSCQSGSIECPQTTRCGEAVVGPTCSCASGLYQCTTPAAATQAALVGKWQGTVTPPSFLAEPYSVSLWIYPDGTYWAEGSADSAAFYVGGNGPLPTTTLTIVANSSTAGASANIGINSSSSSTGAISSLVVTDTTLQFAFSSSWPDCLEPFQFALTR